MPTSTTTPTTLAASERTRPVRVLLLIGSTRADRFCPIPAAWAADRAREREDIDLDVVDLAEADLPFVLPGNDRDARVPDAVARLGRRIADADAVVVVTPVYNHGYPAALKNAIDWYYDEWAATPVGFVSYGGTGGGLHAVEQLRLVFAELHTMTIRNVLSFANHWERFDDAGVPHDADRAAKAATAFYDQLVWWARALRAARAEGGR